MLLLGLWARAGHSEEGWQGFCLLADSGGVGYVRKLAAALGGMLGPRLVSVGGLLGTCLAALRSSGSHALGTHSYLRGRVSAELQWAKNGQRQRVLRALGLCPPLTLSPSVGLSIFLVSLCLYPLLCPPFPLGSTSCVFQPDLLAG